MNAVMLRSLPVQEPGRLVLFGKGHWGGIVDSLPHGSWQLFSYPFYRDVQRKSEVFAGVTAMMSLDNNGRAVVSGNTKSNRFMRAWFRVLISTCLRKAGRRPHIHRRRGPGPRRKSGCCDELPWWRRRFVADPSVVGKTLAIGSTIFKIVGVAPPEFFGTSVGESPDLWIPLAMNAQVPPAWGGEKAFEGPLFQSLYILARAWYWLHGPSES